MNFQDRQDPVLNTVKPKRRGYSKLMSNSPVPSTLNPRRNNKSDDLVSNSPGKRPDTSGSHPIDLNLDLFGESQFEALDFVEDYLFESLDTAPKSKGFPRSSSNCSVEMSDCKNVMVACDLLTAGLVALHKKAREEELKACTQMKSSLEAAARLRVNLAAEIGGLESSLSKSEIQVSETNTMLYEIVDPLRKAVTEKKVLQDALDALSIMQQQNEGIEIFRAANVLSKLEIVVREYLLRNPGDSEQRQGIETAGKRIHEWILDLEKKLTAWFFNTANDTSLDPDIRISRMEQCVKAATAMNGGKYLMEQYIKGLPIFKQEIQQLENTKGDRDDPDGNDALHALNVLLIQVMDTLKVEIETIERVFSRSQLVFIKLVKLIFEKKIQVTINICLEKLRDGKSTFEDYNFDSILASKHISTIRPAQKENEKKLKFLMVQKRRFLMAVYKVYLLLEAYVQDIISIAPKLKSRQDELLKMSHQAVESYRKEFLKEEKTWLTLWIEYYFHPIYSVSIRVKFNPDNYHKSRTTIMNFKNFPASMSFVMEQFKESIVRITTVHGKDGFNMGLKDVGSFFISKIVDVADFMMTVIKNLLPQDDVQASHIELWNSSSSPVSYFVHTLRYIIDGLNILDHFFAGSGLPEKATWDDAVTEGKMMFHVVQSLREHLRKEAGSLMEYVDRIFNLVAASVASRVLKILEKEQKSCMVYALFDLEQDISKSPYARIEEIESTPIDELQVSVCISKTASFLDQQMFAVLDDVPMNVAISLTKTVAQCVKDVLLYHWSRMEGPITPKGAILMASDVRMIQHCFPDDHAKQTLKCLTEVAKLYLLPSGEVWSLIEETEVGKLSDKTLIDLIRQRPDANSTDIKKLLDSLTSMVKQNAELMDDKGSTVSIGSMDQRRRMGSRGKSILNRTNLNLAKQVDSPTSGTLKIFQRQFSSMM